MANSLHPPKPTSKSLLYWLLTILDVALPVLLVLIFYALFTDDAPNLAKILLANGSMLIVIFSLTPTIRRLERVKRTCAKLLFLAMLFVIFCIFRA